MYETILFFLFPIDSGAALSQPFPAGPSGIKQGPPVTPVKIQGTPVKMNIKPDFYTPPKNIKHEFGTPPKKPKLEFGATPPKKVKSEFGATPPKKMKTEFGGMPKKLGGMPKIPGAMPGKKPGGMVRGGTPTKVVRNITPSSDKFQKFPDGRVLCLTCNKNFSRIDVAKMHYIKV